MAEFTAEELRRAHEDLKREYGQEEADKAIEPLLSQLEAEAADVPAAISQAPVSSAKETSRTIRVIGPMLGGMVLGGFGARAASSPGVARTVEAIRSPFLRGAATAGIRASQAAGEFAGQVAGDIGARELTGVPQNLKESSVSAGAGTGIGIGYRTATKGLGGFIGGVPREAIQEAGVPAGNISIRGKKIPAPLIPNVKKVTRPSPSTAGQVAAGISAEGRILPRIRESIKSLFDKLTPERQAKIEILARADASGALIPSTIITDALRHKMIPKAFSREARAINARLEREIRILERGGEPQKPSRFTYTEPGRVIGEPEYGAHGSMVGPSVERPPKLGPYDPSADILTGEYSELNPAYARVPGGEPPQVLPRRVTIPPRTRQVTSYPDNPAIDVLTGDRLPATLKPSEVDDLIRTQLRPKMYSASGKPADTLIADAYREAEKAAKSALERAVPESLHPKNRAIFERLSKMEEVEALFGEDDQAVVNRLRNLYSKTGEKGAQAIDFLSSETDKTLSRDVRTLATRRAFTTDIRERSQGPGAFGAKVTRPVEAISQVMAPFQAFAGPTAGGFQAAGITPFPSQDIVQMIADLLEAYRRPTPLRQEE